MYDWVGIVQGIEIWSFYQMHQPENARENKRHKILWDLEIQTDRLIPIRKPDLVNSPPQKKKTPRKWEREFVVSWILTFRWTLEWKSKKAKKVR